MGADWSRVIKNSLKELTIDHVEETNEVIGNGAYGEVIIVKMGGLRCASKRIHKSLIEAKPFAVNVVVRKFIQECEQMSKLHHPNIVQFLGVYFDCSPIPSLVMELLPTSLGAFLEEYDNAPKYIKHSILLDIAVGLLYLHSQTPPIIHRDLTVNNVLLTHGFKAKIADLGVARTLPPSYTRSRNAPMMTLVPGNSNYMPPEARKETPSYGTKLDIFSFGHLIIHVVLQKWPMILDEFYHPFPDDPEFKEYRTELDRRKKCIDEIKDTNPLKSLVVDCLQDDPDDRPTTCNVLTRLETISSHSPLPFSTPMDVLQALEGHSSIGEAGNADLKQTVAEKTIALEEKARALEEKNRALEEKTCALWELEEKYQKLLAQKEQEIEEEHLQSVPIPRENPAPGIDQSRLQPKIDFQPAIQSTPIGAGELIEEFHWQRKALENEVANLSITPKHTPRDGTAIGPVHPAMMTTPSHLSYQPSPPRPPPPSEPLSQPSSPSEPLSQPSSPSESFSQFSPPSELLSQPSSPSEPLSQLSSPSKSLSQPIPPYEPLSPQNEPLPQPSPPNKPLLQPSPPSKPFPYPNPPSKPLPQSNPPCNPHPHLSPPSEPFPQPSPPHKPLPPPSEPLPQSSPPKEPFPQPSPPHKPLPPPSKPLPQSSPPKEPFPQPNPPSESLPYPSPPSKPLFPSSPPREPLSQSNPPSELLSQSNPPSESLPQSSPSNKPLPQPVIPRPPNMPLPQSMTSPQPTVSSPPNRPPTQTPPPAIPRPLSGPHLNLLAKATPRQPLPLAYILQSEPPPRLAARRVPRPLPSWPPPPPPKRSQSKLSTQPQAAVASTGTSESPSSRSQQLPHSKAATEKSPPDNTQPLGRASSLRLKRPAQPNRSIDPKLAALLNRQQRKINENKPGEGIAQLEASRTGGTPEFRPRAQTLPITRRTFHATRNPTETEAGQWNI